MWGGTEDCEHEWGDEQLTVGESWGHGPHDLKLNNQPRKEGALTKMNVSQGVTCLRCGAWRGELGSEPTIELYVEHIVAVFREVRRVLRKDGTLWLNIGDSYAGSGKGPTGHNGVQNIIDELGSQEFHRIRIGDESRPNRNDMPTDKFVLQPFSAGELEQLNKEIFPKISTQLKDFIGN